jgi:hypothetical protein
MSSRRLRLVWRGVESGVATPPPEAAAEAGPGVGPCGCTLQSASAITVIGSSSCPRRAASTSASASSRRGNDSSQAQLGLKTATPDLYSQQSRRVWQRRQVARDHPFLFETTDHGGRARFLVAAPVKRTSTVTVPIHLFQRYQEPSSCLVPLHFFHSNQMLSSCLSRRAVAT